MLNIKLRYIIKDNIWRWTDLRLTNV